MLTGESLGRAIAQAIKDKKVSKAEVARYFGVKPPSVQDWIRYGRINKKHLDKLFAYFADVAGPEHWGIERTYDPQASKTEGVREQDPKYDLPIYELSPAEKEVIDQIRRTPTDLHAAVLKSIQSVLSAFETANNATTHAGAGHGKQPKEGGGMQHKRKTT